MIFGKKTDSLLSVIDNVFVINGEMIEKNGEDSYAFSFNERMGMVGVFDGCGGIGSRKYAEYNNKTGAYIASRVAGTVVLEWFKRNCMEGNIVSDANIVEMCNNLKGCLGNRLISMDTGTETSTLKGSLTKNFPTTASMILFSNLQKQLYSSFVWSGDSRGFILNEDGLQQITRDDIEGNGDALNNLSADSKLTNFVSSDDFQLHFKSVIMDRPAIFVTATDGCFGYFSTPMEFEYMLIETMMQAETVEQWKANINSYIRHYASDDYTMGVVIYKYKSFEKMKQSFMLRKSVLYGQYISGLTENDEVKEALWEEYKKTYYRGV